MTETDPRRIECRQRRDSLIIPVWMAGSMPQHSEGIPFDALVLDGAETPGPPDSQQASEREADDSRDCPPCGCYAEKGIALDLTRITKCLTAA